jgi:hypothetical protein
VGGGSGHGFKHGPCIGEYVVGRLDGLTNGGQDRSDEDRFRLGPRVAQPGPLLSSDAMAEAWPLS